VNMSSYNIDESDKFKKSLKKIPIGIVQDFKEKAYPQLRENPSEGHNIKKLKGQLEGEYRYKKGNYRLIYSIDEENKMVTLEKLEPRGSAYK